MCGYIMPAGEKSREVPPLRAGKNSRLSGRDDSFGWLGRAVAGTLQHAKVGAPGTHGIAVLVGHNP